MSPLVRRRVVAAAALLAGLAACGAAPQPQATSGSPDARWRALLPLAGYSFHAGEPAAGGILLTGEATRTGRGILALYDLATGKLAVREEIAGAAQLRARSVAPGTEYVAGGDRAGAGAVYARRGSAWERVPIPAGTGVIEALGRDGDGLVAAGSAGDRGVLLAGGATGMVAAAVVAPVPGRFARLTAVASGAGVVLAGGTDGAGGVILAGSGRAYRTVRVPAAVVTGLAHAGGAAFLASGYAGRTDAERRGVLLRSGDGGNSWQTVGIPACVTVEDVAVSGAKGVAAVATGEGDRLIVSRDGGATWSGLALESTTLPATIEAVVMDGDGAWAFGASALYRGPI